MFSKPAIKALFQQYVLVQLYTDIIPRKYEGRSPTTAAENLEFLEKRFSTRQLPLYVILEPLPNGDFKELARYEEGLILNVDGFVQFLKEPLERRNGKIASQAAGGP